MQVQNLFQVPGLLRQLREQSGLSQKALALQIGIDPSLLCALEKGRRHIHGRAQMEAIGKTLLLEPSHSQAMTAAWAHDRVFIDAQRAGYPLPALRLVSAGLIASMCLSNEELGGLAQNIHSAVCSKRELAKLIEQSALADEEVTML